MTPSVKSLSLWENSWEPEHRPILRISLIRDKVTGAKLSSGLRPLSNPTKLLNLNSGFRMLTAFRVAVWACAKTEQYTTLKF